MSTLPDAETLVTLLALHESGSESAAAEVLGIGQSSVSRRVATLQRLTTEPLTVRTAAGTKLTPAGERLLPYAREARSALTAAARWLASDGSAPAEVRIGIDRDLAPRAAAGAARLTGTGLRFAATEGWSRDLVEAVRARRLDVAAVLWAPQGAEPGLQVEDLPEEGVALIAPPGTRLGPADALDVGVLAGRAVFVSEAGSEVAARARAALTGLGVAPEAIVALGGPAAVRAAVMAGGGAGAGLASSFASEAAAGWLVARPLPGGALRPRLVVSDHLPPGAADEVRAAWGLPRRLPRAEAP